MNELKMLKGKLDGLVATEVNREYVGSITIDKTLLDETGILPMEQVVVANLATGKYLKTYCLPGPENSGVVCPNGGCYYMCQVGDPLSVYNYRMILRGQRGHRFTTKLVEVAPDNTVKGVKENNESIVETERIQIFGSKIHQARITGFSRKTPTAVGVSAHLLKRVGISPFEEVQLVNLDRGDRIMVPVMPLESSHNEIIVQGGASYYGSTSDRILLFTYNSILTTQLMEDGYASKVLILDKENNVEKYFEQELQIEGGRILMSS